MKSIALFTVLIVFGSCSIETCIKQAQVVARDVVTVNNDYNN